MDAVDPRLFPAVDPPMSVVLADDERVRRAASSPCGSGNVENGDGSGSSCSSPVSPPG